MTKLDRLPIDRLIASPRLANKAMELGGGSCLAILGCEGAAGRSKAEFDRCRALFEEAGGEDLGPEPGWHWFERRYHISYKLPTLLQQGCMAETLEFATTWAGLPRLYEGVRQAVRGEAVVLAHFSHAYAEGCSIYFTLLAAAGNGTLAKQRYTRFWKAALDAAAAAGATASHHHGVGLMKRTYAAQEAGEALALYRAAKRSIDPEGILNPDKLFPTEGS